MSECYHGSSDTSSSNSYSASFRQCEVLCPRLSVRWGPSKQCAYGHGPHLHGKPKGMFFQGIEVPLLHAGILDEMGTEHGNSARMLLVFSPLLSHLVFSDQPRYENDCHPAKTASNLEVATLAARNPCLFLAMFLESVNSDYSDQPKGNDNLVLHSSQIYLLVLAGHLTLQQPSPQHLQ